MDSFYLLVFYFFPDWSEDQVDKHVKEIQSQLGNYFLRITSPKLATRAKEGSSLSSSLASHLTLHPLNAELKHMVQSLPERIKKRMDALEAGEALDEIMSVLRVVRLPFFFFPFLPSTSYL